MIVINQVRSGPLKANPNRPKDAFVSFSKAADKLVAALWFTQQASKLSIREHGNG